MGNNLLDPQTIEAETRYQKIFESVVDGLIICDLENFIVVDANSAASSMHGYTREEFIGQPLKTIIAGDYQKLINKNFQGVETNSTVDFHAKHICKNGSTIFAEWRGTALTYNGQPCMLSVIRDISSRVQEEQLLREYAGTRTLEQATLLKISQTLASTLELQPGLILSQLHEIIDYTHGILFALYDSTLVTLAMSGISPVENAEPIHIHIRGPEVLDTLFNEHKPIRIANLWSETPQAQFLRSLLGDNIAVLLEGMQSWMWVPLAVKGKIIGGIGVADSRKNYYNEHHADLALSVANQAAITMINADLYGNAQSLAVLEERQSLARNLHDTINQSLFTAGLIAEVLPRLWKRDQDEAWRSLEDLRRLTRGAQAEMRALLAELRPSTLTDADLGELIVLLGNAHSGRLNTPVSVTIVDKVILPAPVQVAFYRVCQEGLFNVGKHAKARNVDITLSQNHNTVILSIHDDGQGFQTDQIPSGHYGINMMRERVEAVGAELLINSQPGIGTTLLMKWPKIQTEVEE